MRYYVTAAAAILLLAVALATRRMPATPAAGVLPAPNLLQSVPDVIVERRQGARRVTVRLRYAGSVTRARLDYELDGRRHTAREASDCARRLGEDGRMQSDGYTTEVELAGTIPDGASNVRLVVESETGAGWAPVRIS